MLQSGSGGAVAAHRSIGLSTPSLGEHLRPPSIKPAFHSRADDKFIRERALDAAVNGLRRSQPELCAGEPTWLWQKLAIVLFFATLCVCAHFAFEETLLVWVTLLAMPFSFVVALKCAALWHAVKRAPVSGEPPLDQPPADWPKYSVLIPLFDEADIVPDLVSAIGRLDYPQDRIEVFFILEEVDARTQTAFASHGLPGHMSVIVVPDGQPRTKPRALNYALTRATGDVVVVYDAEDMPEKNQLRRAAARLASISGIGCVQARLNIINANETWLTRQFAIEYTALFDSTLPALQHLNLPVPLGGTSNHFPRPVLDAVGGWDPFNVTEDADLGIRLARRGYHVEVLRSTTWEEAPANFHSWRNQRTRWIKGWMQTYLVHMRRPAQTARDLGWIPFLGLQVLMAGLVLSPLVHPWIYVLAAWELYFGPIPTANDNPLSVVVGVIGIANLVLGYVTGVALGAISVAKRGQLGLALSALMMPIYWLLISMAAYRAFYQLIVSPYRWEKTRHRPRAAFSTAAAASS